VDVAADRALPGSAARTAAPSRNLVIVHTPARQGLEDWHEVQRLIQERAQDIDVRVVINGRSNSTTRRWQARRPTLVFSAVELDTYRPTRGVVYAGQPMRDVDKRKELARLAAAGLPIPRTVPFTPGIRLEEGEWGPFVVAKPIIGGSGRGVRLVRSVQLARRYEELTRRFGPMIVQQFIEHTNDQGRPGGYRVLTVFSMELYAIYRSRQPRTRSLAELADDPEGVLAFNFDEEGVPDRHRELCYDRDVIALACSIGRGFPERPVLGVDIVREAGTGRLFIMECNPSGRVWHLSSPTARKGDPAFISAIRSQFGAIDRLADILIEKTRTEAS
jgi:hypothetical protein